MKITALDSNAPNFDFNQLSPAKNTLKGCMKYITQYFIPLKDGNIAMFEDGKYVTKDDAIVRKSTLIECQNMISEWKME